MADSYAELAKAYVTLLPTLKGSQQTIQKELDGLALTAGVSAGKKAGDEVSSGISDAVKGTALGSILGNVINNSAPSISDAMGNVFENAFNGLGNVFGTLKGIGIAGAIQSFMNRVGLAKIIGSSIQGAVRTAAPPAQVTLSETIANVSSEGIKKAVTSKNIGKSVSEVIELTAVPITRSAGEVVVRAWQRAFTKALPAAGQTTVPLIGQTMQKQLTSGTALAVRGSTTALATIPKAIDQSVYKSNLGTTLLNHFRTASAKVGPIFKNIGSRLSSAVKGANIGQHITNGAKSGVSKLGDMFKNAFSKAGKQGGQVAGQKAGEQVKNGVGSSIKQIAFGSLLAAGILGGAAAVTGAFKAVFGGAFQNYADFEQQAGGVEAIFDESADRIKAYADQAYKTAQVSANDYMRMTTNFSASLISSLGGDTEKAADMANQAIIQISDNAMRFGTDLESVQYAYQGFAKQNYMMLDNLKLGYGGSKQEMERLIADANEYEKSMGRASNLVVGNFSDEIKAIGIIQDKINVTGTTAKEAATTIEGSFNSAKAAWTNFITGVGRDDANMKDLTDNLVGALGDAARNAIPRFAVILANAIVYIPSLISEIRKSIPELIASVSGEIDKAFEGTPLEGLYTAFKNAFGFVSQFVEKITPSIQRIVGSISSTLTAMVGIVTEQFGQLWDEIEPIVVGLFDYISIAISQILPLLQTIAGLVGPFLMDILTQLKELFDLPVTDGLSFLDLFAQGVQNLADAAGPFIEDVLAFVSTLIKEALPVIQEFFATIAVALVDAQPDVGAFLGSVKTLVENIWNMVLSIIKSLEPLAATIVSVFSGIFDTIFNGGQDMFGQLTGWIAQLVDLLVPIVQNVLELAGALIESLWPALSEIMSVVLDITGEILPPLMTLIGDLIGLITQIWNWVWPQIKPVLDFVVSIIGLIAGAIGGLIDVVATVIDFFVRMASGILEAVNTIAKPVQDFFDGLMAKPKQIVGAFTDMVDGFVQGIKDMLNMFISLFNNSIGSLSWDIPDWIPGIGGQTIGVPKIPMLAEGGVVKKATAAIIGERGPEVVAPLDSPEAQRYLSAEPPAPSIDPKVIRDAIREGMEGFGFNIDSRRFANATRDGRSLSDGNATIMARRGLAY